MTAPGRFDSEPLVAPARYNFPQGLMYRLKLANIPGRPGVELYPSIELAFAVPRTEAFLAHNAIPVQFTEEDFDQVLQGNFVTKVIYLPDPEFQELALAGVETLVSTRLEPGVDPIVEADRRGAILAIVRLGNKDMQLPAGVMETGSGDGLPGRDDGPMPLPRRYARPLCGRRDGAAIRHADVRHAHRTARPAPRAVGSSRRFAESRDRQPHPRCLPAADPAVRIDVRQVPGISYPTPANHVRIVERTRAGLEPPALCQGGAACPADGSVRPASAQQPPECRYRQCTAVSN